MVLKKITTPLDLSNMDNHNYNYEELKNDIRTTDKRLSEDMWEEIKGANTMKMLEPVQTAADLPSEAPDKSFITVIDEQRVYTYFRGEWQPFNQIDLDPFEPFKTELQTMIDNHEAKAQQLLSDMQTEHDNAVTEITNLTNDFNTDYQAKMDAFTSDYQDKSDQLQADYNSYSEQIDTNTTNSLSDIDTAKNDALTELENFQNTDTSNWQKYKLTESNGDRISKTNPDVLTLESGFFECEGATGVPHDEASRWFIDVYQVSSQDAKLIKATLGYTGDAYQRTVYGSSDSGWKKLTGMTKATLFEGSVSGTDSTISLSEPYDEFEYLFVSFSSTPGRQTKIFEGQISDGIVISVNNVYNDSSNAKAYEMAIARTDLTTLTITNEASYTFTGSGSSDSTVVIKKIVGVK